MVRLKLDISKVAPFMSEKCLPGLRDELLQCHKELVGATGKGRDFLGWIDLPVNQSSELINRILEDANWIRAVAEVFVVIGIGGSYLGSRAVIEALENPFRELSGKKAGPQVIFAGENLSEDYHARLLEVLDHKSYAVAVISKSGTTTEPAVAFRLIKQHLENKYGREEAGKRIFAITDGSKGALKGMAEKEGYVSYVIPDNVGGRFSVLTPVGLLPVAVAGFDIRKLLAGAAQMRELALSSGDCEINPCALYAAIRNILYRNGKYIEILVSYEPGLHYFTEWWKQLFGESEGKEGKGIFPAGVNFTSDLHSMGQYIQEGMRTLFETVISVQDSSLIVTIPEDPTNADGLNFMAGKRLSEVNRMAEIGTAMAHIDGGVPNIRIEVPAVEEETLGELIYFFEFSCALSGYALGVNPFDQPGVEAYKKNMFSLLGKPGY